MSGPPDRSTGREHAFWLASRAVQQKDLAVRFAAVCAERGLRVLALKGVSIADELYGGIENRPMADIDFLVVAPADFARASDLARSLGLAETGASDHALVFKEPPSGVVLELHIALTACPGLFPIDHDALWNRRLPVAGAAMWRLSDADLLLHFALHAAFQHALVVSDHHFDDVTRLIEVRRPRVDEVVSNARASGALAPLGLLALAWARRNPGSPLLAELSQRVAGHCPPPLAAWIESQPARPAFSLSDLAFVRYHLAPSKWRFVRQSLFPATLPGRTLEGPGPIRRWFQLASAASGGAGRAPASDARPRESLEIRVPPPEMAEQWIRDSLQLDPLGGELTVSGTCMEPSLMEGTRVRLKPGDRPPRVGDIVLIRTPGGLRLHRVVLRHGNRIRTKGDRGHYLDPSLPREAVIAIQADGGRRWVLLARVAVSLVRLLGRPWSRTSGDEGDPAHARLLP